MPKSGTQLGALTAAAHRIGLSLDEWQARTRAGLKWCYRCRRWLYSIGEHSRFGVDRTRADWTRPACRECIRAADAIRRKAHTTVLEQGVTDATQARADY